VLEARELLDNFMTRRSKFPQWFRDVDPGDPKILDVFDHGYVCILYVLENYRSTLRQLFTICDESVVMVAKMSLKVKCIPSRN